MAVRPGHLGLALPAPLGHAVLVAFSGVAMAPLAVRRVAVHVHRLVLRPVLQAKPGGVVDVVRSGLAEALLAVDRAVVEVVCSHLLIALLAVRRDPLDAKRRDFTTGAESSRTSAISLRPRSSK